MIIVTVKPVPELTALISGFHRILLLGCQSCATVCLAGGARELAIASESLKLAASASHQDLQISSEILPRQCDAFFSDELIHSAGEFDAVVTFGCAAGLQTLVEQFPDLPVLPGVDTHFIGMTEGAGFWRERCLGCGHCIAHLTGGICVLTRCPKRMLNGPCTGVRPDGACETDPGEPCIWFAVAKRMKRLGRLDDLTRIIPPVDWSTSSAGGCRRIIRDEA